MDRSRSGRSGSRPSSLDLSGEPFASRLRSFRKRVGLSHGGMAMRLGVAKSSVKSWERSRSVPTPRHFEAVKALLLLSQSERAALDASWREAWNESRARILAGRRPASP